MSAGVRRFSAVHCALVCAALRWCAASAGQEMRPVCTVHGTVEDRITRQPIARALVEGDDDAVLTDSDGHFELHLRQGTAMLQVRRPGYPDGEQPTQHWIQVSPQMADVDFYLTPSARIRGHVSLSSEEDGSDLRLMPYRKAIVNGHEQWVPAGTMAVVDSDGDFRFLDLAAPAQYVICNLPGVLPAPVQGGGPAFGYPSLCFPGGGDFASASPLHLVPGQQEQLEETLARVPLYPVSFASAKGGMQPLSIQINDRGGRAVYFARWNQERGIAEVRLPSGTYYAEARTMGEKGGNYGRIDFTVAHAALSLHVVVLPLPAIPVVIHREFTPVNLGGGLFAGPGNEGDLGLNLTLAPVGGVLGMMMGGGLRPVDGGGSGSFQLAAHPGRFRVDIQSYQGYVSSITSGGVDLMREPLVIGPGNSSAPIEITLRNDGGEIDCTLNADTGVQASASLVQDGVVYAIPQFPSTMGLFQARLRGEGSCRFVNLPPGSYRVVAFDSIQEIDLDDAQASQRLGQEGQIVTVQAGTTTHVAVDRIRTDREETGQ